MFTASMLTPNNLLGVETLPPMLQSYGTSPLTRLLGLPGVYIQQNTRPAECFPCCCEQPNVYEIFAANMDGSQSFQKLFFAVERSTFLARNITPGFCRPFFLDIYTADTEQCVLTIERPFRCTIGCFQRPMANVFEIEPNGSQKKIGMLSAPWSCLRESVEISDANDYIKSVLDVSCLQAGMLCGHLPCTGCQSVTVELNAITGEKLNTINKKQEDFFKAACTTGDDYVVRLPQKTDEKHRALIIASVLLMDFLHFERWSRRDACKNAILFSLCSRIPSCFIS